MACVCYPSSLALILSSCFINIHLNWLKRVIYMWPSASDGSYRKWLTRGWPWLWPDTRERCRLEHGRGVEQGSIGVVGWRHIGIRRHGMTWVGGRESGWRYTDASACGLTHLPLALGLILGAVLPRACALAATHFRCAILRRRRWEGEQVSARGHPVRDTTGGVVDAEWGWGAVGVDGLGCLKVGQRPARVRMRNHLFVGDPGVEWGVEVGTAHLSCRTCNQGIQVWKQST